MAAPKVLVDQGFGGEGRYALTRWRVGGGLLVGGISTGVHDGPAHGSPAARCCGWCVVVVVVAHCWVVDQQTQHPVVGGGCWCFPGHRRDQWLLVVGGVGGLLFVNYIVDASIFERRVSVIGAHPVWVGVGCWCVVCSL